MVDLEPLKTSFVQPHYKIKETEGQKREVSPWPQISIS